MTTEQMKPMPSRCCAECATPIRTVNEEPAPSGALCHRCAAEAMAKQLTLEGLKTELTLAKQAAQKAESARYAAERARRQEEDAEVARVIREVREKHAAAVESAQRAAHDAKAREQELRVVLSKLEDDGFPVGCMVQRSARSWSKWSSRELGRITVRGIVEVRTATTVLPQNRGRWNQPAIGTKIVRLLKKDGKPGAMVESLAHWLPGGQYGLKPEDCWMRVNDQGKVVVERDGTAQEPSTTA